MLFHRLTWLRAALAWGVVTVCMLVLDYGQALTEAPPPHWRTVFLGRWFTGPLARCARRPWFGWPALWPHGQPRAPGAQHARCPTRGQLKQRLDPARFLRLPRSLLVNLEQVRKLHPWACGVFLLTRHNGTPLSSSRRYGEGLRWFLRRFIGWPAAWRAP